MHGVRRTKRWVLAPAAMCMWALLQGCGQSAPWLEEASIVSTRWEAKGDATAVVRVTVRNDSDQAGRVNVVCDFRSVPAGLRTRWEQETVRVEAGGDAEVELWLARLPTAYGEWEYKVGLVRARMSGSAAEERAARLGKSAEIGSYTGKEIITCTDWETGTKPTTIPPGME